MKRSVFVILVIVLFSYSCEKTEDYSEIPEITLKNFSFDVESKNGFVNQIGLLSFDFVDGNGNIGFIENSDSLLSTPEIPDIFIYEYKKENGNFVINDTINYLLPYFSEGVYRKNIKGEIEIKIYFINRANDTIKYDFQIMDRDYHLSNIESTPELVVPIWN